MAKDNSIGKVVHWYDKIGVAVVKLSKSLKVGDSVKIKHGEHEFTDTVHSMQLNHEAIKSGKKGQEVAIKLSQRAPENSVLSAAE